MEKRSNLPAPHVKCNDCGVKTIVPSTNVKKHMGIAVKVTKEVARKTQEFAFATYRNLSSRPTVVRCSKYDCWTKVTIPPSIWNWSCPEGHQNDVSSSTCVECKKPRPGEEKPERVVTCEICGTETTISGTNVQMFVANMAKKTKETAFKAHQNIKVTCDYFISGTIQHNCSICNAILSVTPPNGDDWPCPAEGCTKSNKSVAIVCGQCNEPRKIEIFCDRCNYITDVPMSRFSNPGRYLSRMSIQDERQPGLNYASPRFQDPYVEGKYLR